MRTLSTIRTFLFVCCVFGAVRCSSTTAKTVYICDSSGATRYHLRADCSGLRNCKHRIIEVTLEEAVSRDRTLCKLER